jgi:hypothetical protein
MIRLALEQLRGEGKVRADGTGRSATWTRIPNTAPSLIRRRTGMSATARQPETY